MALIKCSECGHEVSDKASLCPNCGCPITDTIDLTPKKSKKKWVISSVIAVAFIAICVGCWFAFDKVFPNDDPDAIVELTPEFIEKVQQYDRLAPFSEGRAAVCRDGKWGYINTKGDEVIPCQFYPEYDCFIGAEMFHEGLAQVYKGDSAYYINRKGEIIFEGRGGRFSEGLALLSDDRIVNTKGVTQFTTKHVNEFNYFGGNFPFRTCYTQYPYYENGEICVAVVSDDSNYDGEYICYDRLGNKIDNKGEEQLTADTENDYTVFSDDIDYDEFQTGNHNGLKDKHGNIVIPAKYSEIGIPYPEVDAEYKLFNNGVVLLTIRENDAYYYGLDEDGTSLRGNDGFLHDYTPRYYAFADLKGNTTFSEKVLSHIDEANKIGEERWKSMLNNREVENQREEESKVCPEWIEGTWKFSGYVDGLYLRCTITFNRNTCKYVKTYNDVDFEVGTFSYDADNNMIRCRPQNSNGYTISYEVDTYGESISLGDGHYFERVGNQSTSESHLQSNSVQFYTDSDVIAWLSGKFFYCEGTTLQITYQGISIDGRYLTGAPRVTQFSGSQAIIKASPITGGKDFVFRLNAQRGTMTEQNGDVWVLRR